MKHRSLLAVTLVTFLFLFSRCNPVIARFMAKSIEQMQDSVMVIEGKSENPILVNPPLSLLWAGHATMLIQIHDKVFLTDPLFTRTVGMVIKRKIEPGIDPAVLRSVDYVLISHTHFDHFSYGSLDMLPQDGSLLLPLGALAYTPDFGFKSLRELRPWESIQENGVTITAVPVQHFSGRYGVDILWMRDKGYTGYVIEYKGVTVFFAGDTGYHPELFKEVGRRFSIDVAILPIAPIEPRDFMERNHVDPQQALRIFDDVGARVMIPMHHRTLDQGFDPSPTYAIDLLRALANERDLHARILPFEPGEQRVLTFPPSPASR